MIRKVIFSMFFLFFLIPSFAIASTGSLVKIGNKYYETFEEAIQNAGPNDTISLISDIQLTKTQDINKIVNLNLNGNDITAPEKVFLVQGGTLNLKGKGTIKETNPNYGAIMIKGSANSNDQNYSVVNIGKDITLEGWSGIFITHDNSKSYGVKVNFEGTINAVNDINGGTGVGIYVNGNIKDKTNSPEVNILDNATITSTGNGLYMAGYGTYNIHKAKISGVESGVGIKSGILNIDGATIIGTGPDKTPTTGYGDGIKASGTAIQIESNNGYAGDIELNIDSGTFISNHSYTVYEYMGKGNNSQVTALDISGGNFQSNSTKPNFQISDSLKQYHTLFISGGKYSENPSTHLKTGYSATLNNGIYEVTQSTIKLEEAPETKNNKNIKTTLIIITISIILLIILYINKNKILKFLQQN